MKRLRAAAIAAMLLAAGPSAWAHKFPSRHSVTVQAERDSVAILVVWTSANDRTAQRMLARAAVHRTPDRVRQALESLATQHALAPLSLELDGILLPLQNVETVVTLDPDRPERIAAVVLVTARIPAGAHTLQVSAASRRSQARVMWTDRSSGRASSPSSPGTWVPRGQALSIAWPPSPPPPTPTVQ